MKTNIEVFHRALVRHFSFLKESSTNTDAYLKSILVGAINLVPIGKVHLDNLLLLSEFELSGISRKLSEIIFSPHEVAFVIEDRSGLRIGFICILNKENSYSILCEKSISNDNSFTLDEAALKFSLNEYFFKVCGFNINSMHEVSRSSTYSPKSLILTAGPSISSLETAYAFDAAKNGWNSQWSDYLTRFEEEFALYVGAKYALATSSCTGALHIALMSLGIGAGDEVIVPDLTWVATANAVRFVGATPVFADIELDTWNIDSQSMKGLITERTKAVIAVHMYGHPARMSNILEVARAFDLKVIEDAAPAIGAEWQGKRCGSFGDFAAFSFQGAKLLVTGEGGMLVTNDGDLYERARKIWDQGRNPSKVFWIDGDGVKYKMSNIQAAIGLGQLERAEELIEMKRRLFAWYEEGLSDVPCISLIKEVDQGRSIYWMSSFFLNEAASIHRDELMAQLKLRNIDTRPVFPAISQYPIWPIKQKPQTNALRVGSCSMNLPSGVGLTKDQVMYICRNVVDLLK